MGHFMPLLVVIKCTSVTFTTLLPVGMQYTVLNNATTVCSPRWLELRMARRMKSPCSLYRCVQLLLLNFVINSYYLHEYTKQSVQLQPHFLSIPWPGFQTLNLNMTFHTMFTTTTCRMVLTPCTVTVARECLVYLTTCSQLHVHWHQVDEWKTGKSPDNSSVEFQKSWRCISGCEHRPTANVVQPQLAKQTCGPCENVPLLQSSAQCRLLDMTRSTSSFPPLHWFSSPLSKEHSNTCGLHTSNLTFKPTSTHV